MFRFPFSRRLRPLPTVPRGQRVYAIGDIHGRFDLLCSLLECIEEDQARRGPAQTHFVILGDFIDRGPGSAKTVSLLRWWQRNSVRVTILKGNHEAALVDGLGGDPAALKMWLRHGGLETLSSFGIELQRTASSSECAEFLRSRMPDSTVSWLDQLPLSHRIGDYFFCHAGVRPGIPLHEQDPDDLLWIADEFLQSREDHGAVIVHGHNICGLTVEFAGNRICVDTGAYSSGVLSAVGLEDRRQWSVSTSGASGAAIPERATESSGERSGREELVSG